MAKHNRQACEKQARNAMYADRFPRRQRKQRRDARFSRTLLREKRWLTQHGIEWERAPDVLGLVAGRKGRRR